MSTQDVLVDIEALNRAAQRITDSLESLGETALGSVPDQDETAHPELVDAWAMFLTQWSSGLAVLRADAVQISARLHRVAAVYADVDADLAAAFAGLGGSTGRLP